MPELICRTVANSALEAATGDPHAEAAGVVIAADVPFILNDRQASHFAAPVERPGIQQSALTEVSDQCGSGGNCAAADGGQGCDDAAVVIPSLIARVNRNQADSALDKPSSNPARRGIRQSSDKGIRETKIWGLSRRSA